MKNVKFIKNKKMISWVFTGILFIGAFGITNINNSNKNKYVKNSISDTETISGLANNAEKFDQLSMGEYHSSALTNKGNAYTWGANDMGQLGDGTTTNKKIPTNITEKFGLTGPEKITQLNMGGNHSTALTNEGNAFTWGANDKGQLGDGTTTNKNTPTNITEKFSLTGPEKITQLNMGYAHSTALTSEGNVFTWGNNDNGQLGDETNTNKNIPTNITEKFGLTGPEKITQLNMGASHSSALTSEGNVFTWGNNDNGQLGDETNTNKNIPTNITEKFGLTGPEKITQLNMGASHSSALTSEGNVFTWGDNDNGQLGDGTNTHKNIPTNITEKFSLTGPEKITQLNMGYAHSTALTNKGNVYTWGNNNDAQLGDGTNTNKNIPTNITEKFNLTGPEEITQLNMGYWHSTALTNEGNALTWGKNDKGQLGRDYNSHMLPIKLKFNSEVRFVNTTNITTNSITINFEVIKNHQNGNVVIRDGDGNQKGNENNVNGSSSITIGNLTSNTTYTGWTIEVDGNGKEPIPEFKTAVIKSELSDINPENTTINSVEIHFTVDKNDQDGNVVIRDKDDNEKESKTGAAGATFIEIDGLTSNTTYTGWTIEVDGNGKKPIPEFKTNAIKSELSDIKVENIKTTSVEIHFTVDKNDQDGNVVIRDGDGNQKGNENNVNGSSSITINNLTSNTTYTGWTIEVDGNGKEPIPEFKTAPIKSELSDVNPKNATTNSIEIHFTVIKNDQDGNVVIKDENGTEKEKKNGVAGASSIKIENLKSNTTYTRWTIEVDGNDKTTIPPFTTPSIKSELLSHDVGTTTTNSVEITFEVKQNDGDGNVVIKDEGNNEIGREDNVDGKSSITITGLLSNKKFTGWTIQVDDTPPKSIPDFNTDGVVSKLVSHKVEFTTVNSVKINFEVNKNDGDGDVIIKDNLGNEKGRKENVDGKGSIIIDDLTSNITYTGWTIDVDDDDKKDIPDFKTLEYFSDDIEKDVDIKIKGKLKDSDKQITFQYSQNKLDGTIHHIITYKDGTKQSTSPFYDNYFKGSGEKTYDLNQTIENISEIETIYTIDGYPVVLNSHTGSADKVLGDSIIKPKTGLSPGAITGIALAGLTGILLILFMIYYFKKNNKMKKVKTEGKTKK